MQREGGALPAQAVSVSSGARIAADILPKEDAAKPSHYVGIENGAGDGNRTHDIQLGKLSFYH